MRGEFGRHFPPGTGSRSYALPPGTGGGSELGAAGSDRAEQQLVWGPSLMPPTPYSSRLFTPVTLRTGGTP